MLKLSFMPATCFFKVDYNTVYVVCSSAQSRVGGYQYLGNADDNLFHGPIYVLAKIVKNVMSSAAESEVAGLFINTQHGVPIYLILKDIHNHLHPYVLITLLHKEYHQVYTNEKYQNGMV